MLFSAEPVPLLLLLLLLLILSAELPFIDREVIVEHDYFELGHDGNVSSLSMITD